MVFWSNFAKKIKESISRKEFDQLKNNAVLKDTNNAFRSTQPFQTLSFQNANGTDVLRFVVNTAQQYSTIDGGSGTGIYMKDIKDPVNDSSAANKKYVDNVASFKADKTDVYTINEANAKFGTLTQQQTNTSAISDINNKLANESFIDYKGEYNPLTTYVLSDSVSVGNRWYISKQNNNIGHTPPASGDDNWWLQINSPIVNTDLLKKEMINMQNPIGSMLFTYNGQQHPLVAINPAAFEEITLTSSGDVAYFGIGQNSTQTGVVGDNFRTIQRNQLPNINLSHRHIAGIPVWDDTGCFYGETILSFGNKRIANYAGNTNGSPNTSTENLYLNGNTTQQQISIAPKRVCVRAWKVINKIYNI